MKKEYGDTDTGKRQEGSECCPGRMYKNYIFDLYGTLVDIRTNEQKAYLWQKTAMLFRLQKADYTARELKERYRALVGEEKVRQKARMGLPGKAVEIDLSTVWQTLYREKGSEPTAAQIEDTAVFFRALSLEQISLYPGAEELLKRLKEDGRRIWLLSNAQRIFTVPELHMLGLTKYFDGISLSSDVGAKKPSPTFYQALFDRFQLEKEESVMIGNDSDADIRGAYEFGIDSMYVETAQSPEWEGELPENCRQLRMIGEAYVRTHERT